MNRPRFQIFASYYHYLCDKKAAEFEKVRHRNSVPKKMQPHFELARELVE